VAIVGAGVSGVYAGWRLITSDPDLSPVLRQLAARHPGRPLRVAILEASERIGGRLYSVHPPGMPHLPAEMGGMRIPDSHILVMNLARLLGLDLALFPTSFPNNLVYLRGKRFTEAEFSNPSKVPFNLPANERGKSPADLIAQVINQVVPGGTTLPPHRWDQIKKQARFQGNRLDNLGIWYVVERLLGNEGLALVDQGFGYNSIFQEFNAAEMLELFAGDFTPVPTYYRVRRGYQAIPVGIAARFHRAGGHILLHQRVRALHRDRVDGEPVIRLDVEHAQTHSPLTVRARHVILAVPRRSIQLMDPSSFLFQSRQFREDFNTITPQFATRTFLGFREPWWQPAGLKAGRSVTDLPMRQCFYWGVEGEQPGADPSNRNALFFGSYADNISASFWAPFLNHPPNPGTNDPFSSYGVAPNFQAPRLEVQELMRQVRELHGPKFHIPDPYTALFIDWRQDPYGGSWHFWRPRSQSWDVIPRMRRPIPDANLHICGEAWSTNQGWVAGALNTAEQLLEKQFDLRRPPWLPGDVYLGP
jgi:monoamine oxidase